MTGPLHQILQEQVEGTLLRLTDAWGPERVKRMHEEHVDEHLVIWGLLTGPEVLARFDDIAEELEAHMQAEERTFLSPKVLKDDLITRGPTG